MNDSPLPKKKKIIKKFTKKQTASLKKKIEKVQKVIPTKKKIQNDQQIRQKSILTFKNFVRLDYFLGFFIIASIVLMIFLAYFVALTKKAAVIQLENSYTVHPYPLFQHFNIPQVGADSYIVYETDSRAVIAGKNIQYRFSPASTAKIMTALLAIQNYPMNQIIQIKNIEMVQGSKMGLTNGEKLTVQDLLYGLLLPSGNDAAYTLAWNYPGGFQSFVEKMNITARALHMDNTRYFDPAGYSDDNYTTAFDLARLAAYAMKNPEFAKLVGTKSINVSNIQQTHIYNLYNLNEMLHLAEVTGVKTGFTNEAGEVLVTSVHHLGHTFIIVVMKSGDRFGDSTQLLHSVVDTVQFIHFKNY